MHSGEFALGREHGQGRRKYPDGSVFEGRFRFGVRDGPGTLTAPNGEKTRGTFKDDREAEEVEEGGAGAGGAGGGAEKEGKFGQPLSLVAQCHRRLAFLVQVGSLAARRSSSEKLF